MRLSFGPICVLLLVLPWTWCMAEDATFTADNAGFRRIAVPLLSRFCIDCHGKDKHEGDFDISAQLSAAMNDPSVAAKWGEVVDVLNSHQMPPEDSPQPAVNDVADLVDWVTEQLMFAERVNRSSKVIIRRLNRAEYRNTIRDLMGVDFDVSAFPEDASAGGFDNNGAALSFSPLHTELFLQAAEQVLDKAFVRGPQPKPIRWRFEPESGDSDSNRVRYDDNNVIVNGGQNVVSGPGRRIRIAEWNTKINARDFRVPTAGPFLIRLRVGSSTPSRDDVIAAAERFLKERMQKKLKERPDAKKYVEEELEEDLIHFRESSIYDYGPARVRVIVDLGGQPAVIGEADVTGGVSESGMVTLEFPVTMTTEKAGITLEYAYSIPAVLENFWMQKNDGFPRPELLVDWFELEGPVYQQWPPESYSRWLPAEMPLLESEQVQLAKSVLEKLMPLAYRRPVTSEEITVKLQLFDAARKTSGSFETGLRTAMCSVLISPHFLYLVEPSADPNSPLTQYELASRLSYFLWSSMPDQSLQKLAREGKLSSSSTRAELVDSMLDDRRSEAMVVNFASQWLGLREVGSNPPARDLFPRYDDHLESSLVQESLAFFDEVLRNDLSLDCFVDSDFVMINERLARFYQIKLPSGESIRGDQFRRVEIDASVPRGGVLTQGSVLTTTSNGTRTTPVKRGTWILKTILDADPGLPVANAGEIAPKVPGIDKATVRQRLEIHRELPQCARCHDKIDPLGFALENFDAAGQWRTQEGFGYKGRIGKHDPQIDASGRLPDGTLINGIDDLQKALLQRREELHRSLASKMFTYGLGREMTLTDQPQIEEVVGQLSSQGDNLRTLLKAIVTSETFVKR